MRSPRRSPERWHDSYLMKTIGDAGAPDGIRSDKIFWRRTIRASSANADHHDLQSDRRSRLRIKQGLHHVRDQRSGTGRTVIACRQQRLVRIAHAIGYSDDGRLRYRQGVRALGMANETREKICERDNHQHGTTQNERRTHRIRSCDFASHVLRITKRKLGAKCKSTRSRNAAHIHVRSRSPSYK